MNTPKFRLKYPIYLFLMSRIGHQTVDKQMKSDVVIMVRPALMMATMKLSFLQQNKNLFSNSFFIFFNGHMARNYGSQNMSQRL